MYTLLSGFYNYITRKEEYYVLIIGLDNAGKTVSLFEKDSFSVKYFISVMSKTFLHYQTLLERIKSIFMGVAGLDPDKIAPTVGLNSK